MTESKSKVKVNNEEEWVVFHYRLYSDEVMEHIPFADDKNVYVDRVWATKDKIKEEWAKQVFSDLNIWDHTDDKCFESFLLGYVESNAKEEAAIGIKYVGAVSVDDFYKYTFVEYIDGKLGSKNRVFADKPDYIPTLGDVPVGFEQEFYSTHYEELMAAHGRIVEAIVDKRDGLVKNWGEWLVYLGSTIKSYPGTELDNDAKAALAETYRNLYWDCIVMISKHKDDTFPVADWVFSKEVTEYLNLPYDVRYIPSNPIPYTRELAMESVGGDVDTDLYIANVEEVREMMETYKTQ